MKNFAVFLMGTALLAAFTIPALAADEFGERFQNRPPAALEQNDEAAAAEADVAQGIEPAAGDNAQDAVPKAEQNPVAAGETQAEEIPAAQ